MTERTTSLPVTDRGRTTRSKLLTVAERVFGDHGYENASITAITQEAGVAQGSFYTYFPSKRAIFEEVIRTAQDDLRRTVSAASVLAAAKDRSRTAIERAAMEAAFEFFNDRPGVFTIVRQAQVVAPDMYRWWIESFLEPWIANFDRFTPGRHPELDLEAIACVVHGAFDMLLLWYVHWRGTVPPRHVIDQTFDMLGRGLDAVLPTRPDGGTQ